MRTIGGKYHVLPDGQIANIVSGEVIPLDEPLFLLRARDIVALPALLEYHRLCQVVCCATHILGVGDGIDAFTQFNREHYDRMKEPGSSLRKKP